MYVLFSFNSYRNLYLSFDTAYHASVNPNHGLKFYQYFSKISDVSDGWSKKWHGNFERERNFGKNCNRQFISLDRNNRWSKWSQPCRVKKSPKSSRKMTIFCPKKSTIYLHASFTPIKVEMKESWSHGQHHTCFLNLIQMVKCFI